MSKEVPAQEVMGFLNLLFSKFDALCDVHGVYKVETAGDCYSVAGALMKAGEDGATSFDSDATPQDGAKRVLQFAKVLHSSRSCGRPTPAYSPWLKQAACS